VTTFHLVRHAAHDLLGRVLAGRTLDVGLNGAGERQAQMLALRLKAEPIARVLSSPRRRTRATAAPIAAALGLDVGISSELDEHDAGEWSGQAFETLRSDPNWRRWNEHRGAMRPPGGEAMAELQARVVGCLHDLRDRHSGEALVLVSHAEPIRTALMFARGIAFDDFLKVEVPVGSVTTISLDRYRDLAETQFPRLNQGAA
jgi:probable phosphoglycerate mutase